MSDRYEELREAFRWDVPARFNIAAACVDRHDPASPALVVAGGSASAWTFGDLTRLSSRFSNALRRLGVEAGDRVGVVLPQRLETAVAHVAAYRLGAVAVPMSVLFGAEALTFRLGDSGARVVVTDHDHLELLSAAATGLDVRIVVVDEPPAEPHASFDRLVAAASDRFETADTGPDTPALLIYTSGTTGPPKGALHGHRVVLGHEPGFRLSHDGFPQEGDRFWTVADWAWIGGLVNGLLSTWLQGRPMVAATRAGFEPEWAVDVLTRHGVRNTFLPPTALKLMRAANASVPAGTLRTVMSGGESLGADVLDWAREALGVTVNEIFGQTEVNYVIGNSQALWPVRPGSMGRAYPGHTVAVLGDDDRPVGPGEVGELAVELPDPVAFLGYWNGPDATAEKTRGGWVHTGDRARADGDGYLWFEGRTDDVISSAGYRIGPDEIEQCLCRHPAVALAAAIGVPDETRGEIVKAFVRLVDGAEPTAELAGEIQRQVRIQLAAYEYPRELEFVDELPLTVTGKVRRAELRARERERRASA
jgi:acetyl-CoA synthetase